MKIIKPYINYIYNNITCKFFLDGRWGAWGNFSVCSVTCGNGTQIRYRHCDNPVPKYGGADCVGPNSSSFNCSRAKCPVVGNQYLINRIKLFWD